MEFFRLLYVVPALSLIHFNSLPQNLNLQFQHILFADDTSVSMYHPKSDLFQY